MRAASWTSTLLFFLLSLLFLLPPVRQAASRALLASVYRPLYRLDQRVASLLTAERDRERWLRVFIDLSPDLQQRALARLDSLWGVRPSPRIAHALAFDPLGVPQRILIDRGARDSVAYGEVLVHREVLVGKVVQVNPRTAWVNTVYHPDLRVGVASLRTGVLGVYAGGPRPWIKYLPAWADVAPGDTFVSSGVGGLVPPGLRVAVVRRVDTLKTNPFYLRVDARPLYDHARSAAFVLLRRADLRGQASEALGQGQRLGNAVGEKAVERGAAAR